MKNRKWLRWVGGIVLLVLLLCGAVVWWASQQVSLTPFLAEAGVADVELPPGFSATVFAEGLDGPRFMAVGPDNQLYVADRRNGRIVALPDQNEDGQADEIRVFAADVGAVHSIIFHEGAWYAGIPSGVIRFWDDDGDGVSDRRETVIDNLPTSGSHTTRTVEFLPDGRMVVSVGSSCNVCEEDDPRRAAIVVYDGPDGGGETLFATGLRNAVGLDIEPVSGTLWATNNGRDLMGDDTPPETIFQVAENGFYGWPVCHSAEIIDPDMGFPSACDNVLPPVVDMQAHSAPLGLAFYDGDAFPVAYQDDLFIAFHGSWNRSVPTGYKIVRLPFEDGQPDSEVVDFATGWLDEETGEAAGRPVGVTVGADGALYVSDDKGGYIYRIAYQE